MQGYRGTAYEERKVTDNKKRFEVALEAAASASSFLLSHENLRHEINRKGSNDYVTLADKKCEEIIINRILESSDMRSTEKARMIMSHLQIRNARKSS